MNVTRCRGFVIVSVVILVLATTSVSATISATSPFMTKKDEVTPQLGYTADTASNGYALGTFSAGAGATINEGGKLISYTERSFASGKVRMHFSFRYRGGSQ